MAARPNFPRATARTELGYRSPVPTGIGGFFSSAARLPNPYTLGPEGACAADGSAGGPVDLRRGRVLRPRPGRPEPSTNEQIPRGRAPISAGSRDGGQGEGMGPPWTRPRSAAGSGPRTITSRELYLSPFRGVQPLRADATEAADRLGFPAPLPAVRRRRRTATLRNFHIETRTRGSDSAEPSPCSAIRRGLSKVPAIRRSGRFRRRAAAAIPRRTGTTRSDHSRS